VSVASQELYAVGTVAKAIGVKGEVIVEPMTATPRRFKRGMPVFIGATPQTATRVSSVERATTNGRGVRLKLAGLETRTEAEQLRGAIVFVDADHLVRPPRGSYFVHDIVGMTVETTGGAAVGKVTDVWKLPANDVFVIAGPEGEILIPAVKEFVTRIDPATRTIRVKLIEGMVVE
jgi:16S rRNA processing protein RimM